MPFITKRLPCQLKKEGNENKLGKGWLTTRPTGKGEMGKLKEDWPRGWTARQRATNLQDLKNTYLRFVKQHGVPKKEFGCISCAKLIYPANCPGVTIATLNPKITFWQDILK